MIIITFMVSTFKGRLAVDCTGARSPSVGRTQVIIVCRYMYRQTMQTCPVRFTRGVRYLKVIVLFDISSVTLYVIFLFSCYLIIG